MVEAIRVRNVKDEDATMSPAIVARCQRAESFLPRRVPQLESDAQVILAVQESLRFAINTNSWLVILSGKGFAFSDAHQHGRFTSVRIPNYNDFILLIEGLFRLEYRCEGIIVRSSTILGLFFHLGGAQVVQSR